MKKNTAIIVISVLAIITLVFCALYVTSSSKKNSEIAILNATVVEQEEKIESLNTEITGLNTELLDRAKTIEDLKAENEEDKANIQSLSETVTELESQIASAKSNIEELSTEASNLTEELTACESTIKEQTSSIAERDLTIESLNARIEELNRKIESMSVQITQYKDLSSMSTDELLEIKAIVTAELTSRPENEATVLKTGDYLVGRDIKAGAYYATYGGGSWSGGSVTIYPNDKKERDIYEGHINKSLSTIIHFEVEDGNLICVENNDIKINTTGFPQYVAPEGTKIPIGVYRIGTDIPADNYILSFSGEGSATIDLFANKEDYDRQYEKFWTSLDAIDNQVILALDEGNYISITGSSIIMAKGTMTFTFD